MVCRDKGYRIYTCSKYSPMLFAGAVNLLRMEDAISGRRNVTVDISYLDYFFVILYAKLSDNERLSNNLPEGLTLTEKFVLLIFNIF